MSQASLVLLNVARTIFRQDLNAALAAVASRNAGPTAPPNPFAYMLWEDTTAGYTKIRNAGNSAWERFIPDAPTQPQSVWNEGTETAESRISPAKLKAAVDALTPEETVTDDRLDTGAATAAGIDWVLVRSLYRSNGSVGMPAFMQWGVGSAGVINPGASVSGINLRYSSAGSSETNAVIPPGTWRCLGYMETGGSSSNKNTLFVRIA